MFSFMKAKREKKPEKKDEEAEAECEPCKQLAEKEVRVPPKTRPDYHRKP